MPNVNNDARTTSDWETYIGEQCRSTRIRANLEQEEVATLANISTGAIKNLEGGKGSSLKTLIKVMRALGRTDWLEALAPKISVSPMQMLKTHKKATTRMKVYRARKTSHTQE